MYTIMDYQVDIEALMRCQPRSNSFSCAMKHPEEYEHQKKIKQNRFRRLFGVMVARSIQSCTSGQETQKHLLHGYCEAAKLLDTKPLEGEIPSIHEIQLALHHQRFVWGLSSEEIENILDSYPKFRIE